jgi:hypothetical protein
MVRLQSLLVAGFGAVLLLKRAQSWQLCKRPHSTCTILCLAEMFLRNGVIRHKGGSEDAPVGAKPTVHPGQSA